MKPPLVIVAIFAALLGGCLAPVAPNASAVNAPEYFPVQRKANPPLPFSEAVRVGDMLYLAGQLGTTPGTINLVPGGIGPETVQVMENIKAVLERHGTSLEHAVKCTVFLADIKEWPAFNEAYRGYFKKNLPARSALGTSGLALGARVEVEVIAWIPPVAK